LDENKKEFIRDKKRISQEYVHYIIQQIKKAEKRKDTEHIQKRKHLAEIYSDFKPKNFDVVEDYEIKWTNKYNKNPISRKKKKQW
jgi:hypothetical protein